MIFFFRYSSSAIPGKGGRKYIETFLGIYMKNCFPSGTNPSPCPPTRKYILSTIAKNNFRGLATLVTGIKSRIIRILQALPVVGIIWKKLGQ